ncbi:MAG: hypothetical protein PQJ59_02885 [Spirochaetales bacterium]|nr:hypothetical protein [Spirochaetales bacterium]
MKKIISLLFLFLLTFFSCEDASAPSEETEYGTMTIEIANTAIELLTQLKYMTYFEGNSALVPDVETARTNDSGIVAHTDDYYDCIITFVAHSSEYETITTEGEVNFCAYPFTFTDLEDVDTTGTITGYSGSKMIEASYLVSGSVSDGTEQWACIETYENKGDFVITDIDEVSLFTFDCKEVSDFTGEDRETTFTGTFTIDGTTYLASDMEVFFN